MSSINNNVYIDKLDDVVNEYNNTYHSTIKVKPVDVYIDMCFRKILIFSSLSVTKKIISTIPKVSSLVPILLKKNPILQFSSYLLCII